MPASCSIRLDQATLSVSGTTEGAGVADECRDEWSGQAARRVTALRFLIDENLSPVLVEQARARGFEAMHVNHLGLDTVADWDLLGVVAERYWVLVTNNAIEFRRRHRAIELHPGVVFLLPSVRRPDQIRLSEGALITSNPTRTRSTAPST